MIKQKERKMRDAMRLPARNIDQYTESTTQFAISTSVDHDDDDHRATPGSQRAVT
jgi:hypothetical protein